MAYASQVAVPSNAKHSLLYGIHHSVVISGVIHDKTEKLRLDLLLCHHCQYILSNVDPGVPSPQTQQPQQDSAVDAVGI